MTDDEHYRKLERMYAAAPISQWYGITIAIAEGRAEVRLGTRPEFITQRTPSMARCISEHSMTRRSLP